MRKGQSPPGDHAILRCVINKMHCVTPKVFPQVGELTGVCLAVTSAIPWAVPSEPEVSPGAAFFCAWSPVTHDRLVKTPVLIAIALVAAGGCASSPAPRPRTTRDLTEIDQIVRTAAARHRVDAALVRGVIQVESGFRPDARSSVGARGLMQLMPKTAASLARRLGWETYDIEDPGFNIDAGTAYLAYLLERFDNDARLALAAYNTGPARVARWVRKGSALPSYSRRYVRAVLAAASQLQSGPPVGARSVELDSAGLKQLLRARLYGTRSDEEI